MKRIVSEILRLRILFSRRDKFGYLLLFAIALFGAMLEAAGVVAIPLYVSALIKPSSLSDYWLGSLFGDLPEKADLSLVVWASVILVGFVVLKNIFLSFGFWVQASVLRIQIVRIRDKVFRAYQSAPYEWLVQRSSSDLLRNMHNDCTQVFNGVVVQSLELIVSIITIIFIVGAMLVAAPGPTLMSIFVVGAGSFLIISVFRTRLTHVGEVMRFEFGETTKAIQQSFGALADARIAGREDYFADAHLQSLERMSIANRTRATIQKSTPYAVETVAIIGLILILILVINSSESLEAALPILSMLAFAIIRLKQLASKLAGGINLLITALPNIDEVVKDFEHLKRVETIARSKARSQTGSIGEFEKLEVNNVTYFYPETQTPALDVVSLNIKKGESIGLVGATGCGKSTLVNLILGLLEPTEGEVRVNGVNTFSNMDGWRSNLAYIPQNVYLLDENIRRNVAFGVPIDEIDDKQVWNCLRMAKLASFIESLPEQLETEIGERGVRMSGGQRQRLGIARALYRDPKLLVMDEATSALDNQTETEVMDAIRSIQQTRTVIMIAHRLSTVIECDRLYFLDHGKIIAQGTYDELLKDCDSFKIQVSGMEVGAPQQSNVSSAD